MYYRVFLKHRIQQKGLYVVLTYIHIYLKFAKLTGPISLPTRLGHLVKAFPFTRHTRLPLGHIGPLLDFIALDFPHARAGKLLSAPHSAAASGNTHSPP